MRLGVITSSYPRHLDDWAGSFVRREALRWVRAGHELVLLAPGPAPVRPRDEGIRVVDVDLPPGLFDGLGAPEAFARRPLRFASRVPWAMATWLAVARRELADCDALLAHWLLPAGALVAAIANGRPYGIIEHSTAGRWALALSAPGRCALRAICGRAAFVGAANPELAARLSTVLARGVHWLGPDAALDGLAELGPRERDRTQLPDVPSEKACTSARVAGNLVLGFLGRRVPVKGLDLLACALERLPRSARPRLLLGGPADDEASSRRLASLTQVEDLGVVRGAAQRRAFFASIDALLLPSRQGRVRAEGMPCVLLEAWAAGRPVLAPQGSAAAECGLPDWLFVPGDPHSLAERLARLQQQGFDPDATQRHLRATLHELTSRWQRAHEELERRLTGSAERWES